MPLEIKNRKMAKSLIFITLIECASKVNINSFVSFKIRDEKNKVLVTIGIERTSIRFFLASNW